MLAFCDIFLLLFQVPFHCKYCFTKSIKNTLSFQFKMASNSRGNTDPANPKESEKFTLKKTGQIFQLLGMAATVLIGVSVQNKAIKMNYLHTYICLEEKQVCQLLTPLLALWLSQQMLHCSPWFSTCEHECDSYLYNNSHLQGQSREKGKNKKGSGFLLEALLGIQFFSWCKDSLLDFCILSSTTCVSTPDCIFFMKTSIAIKIPYHSPSPSHGTFQDIFRTSFEHDQS